jgi:hypothetical protein
MKTRVIKKRSFHLLSSLLVAIACTHMLKPVESFAQTTMPSKLTLRNGSQPSDSLIKALLDWKELEGQRVTISDVNLSCLNDICLLIAGGQGIRIQSSQLQRDVREQILRCSVFGCPVTITGVIGKYGRNPILEPQNITFLEGTQDKPAISQSTIFSKKIPDGIYMNGSVSGEATEVVFVEAGKYHTDGSYEIRARAWKPISESGIKYVAPGIIFYPKTANPYYCTKEAAEINNRPRVRGQPIGTCSADGWSWK